MKCHTNVNCTPPTQLPHKFSYIVAILIHNHFESPNHLMEICCRNKIILVILTFPLTEIKIIFTHLGPVAPT
jgi:hypothetical protein